MGISTHVLNTAIGRPAAGMSVTLERVDANEWSEVTGGVTDVDGRLGVLVPDADLRIGTYRITFGTGVYFASRTEVTMYPEVTVDFEVHDASEHYHVPLLVSAWGLSTYRGS